MTKFHGRNIMAAFAEAVGLNPSQCRAIEIRLSIDDVARIRVEGFAEMETEQDLANLVREFYLCIRDSESGQLIGPVTQGPTQEEREILEAGDQG